MIVAARDLVREERSAARQDEHLQDIRIRVAVDSTLIPRMTSGMIAILSYSAVSPLYLYTEGDLLQAPWAFQPHGGAVRERMDTEKGHGRTPVVAPELPSADRYADSTVRVLASLAPGSTTSASFGPYDLTLDGSSGVTIQKGEANYRLAIGRLHVGHRVQLASRVP